MYFFTEDVSLDGRSRKRQAAIDLVRLTETLLSQQDDAGLIGEAEAQDISNVLCVFKASLPKADRDELRDG